MTESESVVYRVVPKCACSTIGQIMYYSDNGQFFDGDIHDADQGMHKWALEPSQGPITRNVEQQRSFLVPLLLYLGLRQRGRLSPPLIL